jgi:putative acetyltransferase
MARIAPSFELLDADDESRVPLVRELMLEYALWLKVDLSVQQFDAELAGLPGAYAPQRGGCVLLATQAGASAGCVALRALEAGICEMKRLWVREAFRGSGLGQKLAQAVLQRARELGYEIMRLDTLAHMDRARLLYARLGFREIAPYYDSALPNTIYLEKALRP